MLQIWIGRANTGKSRRVLEKIHSLGDTGRGQILLVPEHASHQAELDLCRACGHAASRHAEVLSFQRLASRVLALTGGLADYALDAGGKLLMMQRALQSVAGELSVYQHYSVKEGFLSGLVSLMEELRSYCVPPERLADASEALGGIAAGKFRDLSLIYAAYQSQLGRDGADRRDLLDKLVDHLEESAYIDGKDIFLDGFAYFSAREERLIGIMLRRAASVTITVLGDRSSRLSTFQLGIRTCSRLADLAERCGVGCVVTDTVGPAPASALDHLEAHFLENNQSYEGDCSGVDVYRADSMFSEVEYVAAQILALVRTGEYRFRDIAVTARNLEQYEATIENVFERYGVPVYLSRRSDVLEKPVLSLIAGVLDSVAKGFEYEDMFRWLKTGLAGLTDSECDVLENYVIQWDVRGRMWLREENWTANPDGWQEGFSPEQEAHLARINACREKVRLPLSHLAAGLRERETAGEKLEVLYGFLEEIALPEQLRRRTERLQELGQLQQAQEYSQLWDVLCGVMDQFYEILGDVPLGTEEFARLLKLVLTQYDVGTIPVALDQVQIAQITRNDRHQVKCLFLMGANDHVLPAVQPGSGLLSREDREQLRDLGVELAPSGDDAFDYELLNLYAALVQPRSRLTVTWPASDLAGNQLRPSFVVGRIRMLLPGVKEQVEDGNRDYRLTAPIPAMEMAGSSAGGELWNYFAAKSGEIQRMEAMERAAKMERGRLSPHAVRTLYGRSYRMSASRIDKVNSCHFAYFMQYGLRARERSGAGFDAAQVGTFLHYVLEHVTAGAMDRGGFAALEEGELRRMIDAVIRRYMDTAMPGFQERDRRFQYLFRRLRGTVTTIVENVAQELTDSDFVPMAFELEFSDSGSLPAISIHAPEAELTVVGKVDRVDGWLKDGKLYLRVVDYKSGKKAFDLTDIRYGLNLQMLLYLFTLQREGKALFGKEIVPAGVLYLPARDVLLSMDRNAEPERLRQAVDKELRRSGLVLSEPEVLHAMEHSALESPRFLPLTLGRDGSITKGIATAEQLGKLGRYVDKLLERVARELREGNIDADPCGHNENDNVCLYCEFASACHFMDGYGEDRMELLRPVRPEDFWRYVDQTIGEEERP